ncbi:MAG: hypothetical protein P8Z79_26195, partial [Sedimentisphaerales bacterium]
MARHKRTVVVLSVALISAGILIATAIGMESSKSKEFRDQFIKSFHRTGLNTTPSDAMMLRILVESSRAKRGVEVGS